MITHVVLFKLNEPVSDNATEVSRRLLAMDGKVESLQSIRVGRDVGCDARAYDLCLMTTHADTEALAAYQADPIHMEVKAFIGTVAQSVALVDFES